MRAALQMHVIPGRGSAWMVIDVRDLAAMHLALLEPGRGPRRYMAGGQRVPPGELASLLQELSGSPMMALPIPDIALRWAGRVLDQVERALPISTPFTEAGMQYYTQMPESDDTPAERDLGIVFRTPRETLADTIAGIRG